MKVRITRALIFLALGLGLSQITLGSLTPEKNTTLWPALPAFGIFLLFVYALLSTGAFTRTRLKLPFFSGAENALFDLSVGVTAFYELAYLMTPVHLFSSSMRIFLWVLLSGAVALGAEHIHFKLWFGFAKSKWSKFFLAVPLLIVLLKLIEGVQFPLHGDAYIAYLPGPRSWGAKGDFSEFLKFPQFFIATTWEALYAWGTALMGLKGGAGLDLTQFFAQWCTGGVAVLGVVLGSIALSFRLNLLFPVVVDYFPVVAVYAVQIPILRWTSNLAKNDTGIAFLGLAAFYQAAFLAPLSPWLSLIAGVITGAAVMGKLTIGLLGVCIGTGLLISKPKSFAAFVAGGLVGIAPVILRNFILTHNPVFPWYENLFPSGLLSPALLSGAGVATHTSLNTEAFFTYLKELHHELPLWPGMALVLFLSSKRGQIFKSAWIPILAIFLFTCTFRSSTEVRYQNASLVIMAVFFCYYSFYLLAYLPVKFVKPCSILFALVLVGTANITAFTFFQIGTNKFAPLKAKLGSLTGGDAKLWIRQNLNTTNRILIIGDPNVYYLLDYQITELVQSIEWDTKIGTRDSKSFLNELRIAPFDYLYFAKDLSFFNRLSETEQVMKESAAWNLKCKRLETSKVQIWDLTCLKAQEF